MKVFLDTGVLGFVTHPKSAEGKACAEWMLRLLEKDVEFIIPEICDYELRRKYLHKGFTNSLSKLDALADTAELRCVDTAVWRDAARLWADCRNSGQTKAPPDALDGDVLLVSTVLLQSPDIAGERICVATTNVKHLEDFVDAQLWTEIDT